MLQLPLKQPVEVMSVWMQACFPTTQKIRKECLVFQYLLRKNVFIYSMNIYALNFYCIAGTTLNSDDARANESTKCIPIELTELCQS